MLRRMLGFRQRPLHPLGRRLRQRLLAAFSNRPPRSQRVYVVTINGRSLRVVPVPTK